eukprot:CAMPEP_0119330280 /NCGR_PEP_ID=MMETSP1333-20130426/77908_1 /TAXON_ID=418940 /ORGANISM="Scyphosphaera apsteinii, Strain RCC1455" /LENGTH=388 /DNA_ID=CAMNT_0007339637 /DNA_START=128 /DNA_END=1294 /DNA_ORIENTATION=-
MMSWSLVPLLLTAVIVSAWQAFASQLAQVHAGEALYEAADQAWAHAITEEDATVLSHALQSYEHALELEPLMPPNKTPNGWGIFIRWLARPLRLRCLHRIAAAREMLRKDPMLIVQAHSALLHEHYCHEVISELPATQWVRGFESCVAPLARGTILFAADPAAANAAFAAALQLSAPDGSAALSWTSRWQLPDHHLPGLRAQPFWRNHPAVETLEAAFTEILAEFEAIMDKNGGDKAADSTFSRRRADAWIATPRDGWGMLPLETATADKRGCIAKVACKVVRKLQQSVNDPDLRNVHTSTSLSGAGYYRLRPGTRLQAHAGPTNQRLTCHLTLRGSRAWLTVGGDDRQEWCTGNAFCFDDSFVHEAVHSGSTDRYVLLVDMPHPDLN